MDEPEVEVSNNKLSEYTDINTLSKSLQHAKGGLSMLSLNSQILSAKFDDFQVVTEQLNANNAVSVICLQDTSALSLLHHYMIYQIIS